AAGVALPLNATTRPSASSVAPGYQRGNAMLGPLIQVLLVGSKMFVSLMPTSPPLWPPTTRTRPSAMFTMPEQKICDQRLGTLVNVLELGCHRRADGVPPVSQASHISTSPVCRSTEWTSTSGQLSSGAHSPISADVVAALAAVNVTSGLADTLPN